MPDAEDLRARLEEAHAALLSGQAADAERRAKAVAAIVHAAREVEGWQMFQKANEPDHDEDAQRAELLGRITRLIAAEDDLPDEVFERIARGEIVE